MKYDWVPSVRFGPLRFNAPVESYVERGILVLAPYDEEILSLDTSTDWDRFTYADDEDTVVYVEGGHVESIGCYNQCILHGRNLVGMDFRGAQELIGVEPTHPPELGSSLDDREILFYYESAGAMVWVRNWKVVNIFCSKYDDIE